MSAHYFRVLDAANSASDQIVQLTDDKRRRLLHVTQMRRAGQSIAANIAEAKGRASHRDRIYKYEVARGEAEETMAHLSSNLRTGRITPAEFQPLNNRLRAIVKMLSALIYK